ncbi:MAG: sulfatase-like hydrolase/transferase [Alphaproteobacteria bacterium]|nr:sulfatase-like hydrolase/transferase [Alphaproteobacteria bacterium]
MLARAVVLAAALAALGAAPSHAADKPNIVILFADDLGYGDLGVQGDKETLTPNIDAMAADGVRLTDYYADHPVCSPSRAALMTGVYQQRMGFEFNSGSPQNTSPKFGIALDVPTLPERLKAAGYTTGMFGKWHVGFRPETQPTARGFDEFYGFLSGAMPFTPKGAKGRPSPILRGTTPEPMPAHTTEAFAAEAVAFIKAHKDGPFFVYLPFNAVHAPMDTTDRYYAMFPNEKNETRRIHLAMLAALDDAVGLVRKTLDEEGLAENTFVAFLSDNGGPTQQTTSSNAPLNGVKGLVLEGGIRVPAIFAWKGHLPAGTVIDTVAMGFDVTATSLQLAGVLPESGLDGVDIMPFLTGEKTGDAHDALYWRSGGQGAMRAGPWKLVKNGDSWHLFNLATDISEHRDLAAEDAGRLASMKAQWTQWSGEMKDPLWVRNELAGGDRQSEDRANGAIERMIRGEAIQLPDSGE